MSTNQSQMPFSYPVLATQLEVSIPNDELHTEVLVIDTTIMFTVPLTKGNQRFSESGTRFDYLNSGIGRIAGGFTSILGKGVWNGLQEDVSIYIVSLTRTNIKPVLRAAH